MQFATHHRNSKQNQKGTVLHLNLIATRANLFEARILKVKQFK